MLESSGLVSTNEERAELEAVIEALGRSSRLTHLLQYLGEKHLAGEIDQLSEYTIATEVFGRSKTTFNASEDAIVRVEAHRLRKRLKEFYDGPGKNHALQLTIPPGTYVPTFARKTIDPLPRVSSELHGRTAWDSNPAAPHPIQTDISVPDQAALPSVAKARSRRLGLIAGAGAVLLCGILVMLVVISRSHTRTDNAVAALSARQDSALGPVPVPVRLLAGYSGAPQTDSTGQVWDADHYFRGGGPWRLPDAPIARTSDPFLFQNWRMGDSSYDIPLPPGIYELHLYFVSTDKPGEGDSTFSVRINNNIVLSGLDIDSDALGANIADERVFRDISPAADGKLHIGFASERGAPRVNAVEIVPGLPHRQLPIRLIMQRTPYTDHSGQFWHPDDYFMDGRLSDQRQEITGSSDPDLFVTERYGHFNYALPVDTRDRYTLILHFVEFYFGSQAAGGGGAGSRIFKVMCNGNTLLDNFDIYKEAGTLHVLTKTFYHLKPSAQGKLNLTFEPINNNATVSGIEVLDESQ